MTSDTGVWSLVVSHYMLLLHRTLHVLFNCFAGAVPMPCFRLKVTTEEILKNGDWIGEEQVSKNIAHTRTALVSLSPYLFFLLAFVQFSPDSIIGCHEGILWLPLIQ